MSGETTEWRRGGDPANPPIDRVGVWERRNWLNKSDRAVYHIASLDGSYYPQWDNYTGGSHLVSSESPITLHQDYAHNEWRYIGPLPGEQSGKGDREAFCRAYWQSRHNAGNSNYDGFTQSQLLFLESPAGRAAVLALWGEKDCNGSCDIALARRQVGPDGVVPGNARECAELWEREASRLKRLYDSEEEQHGSTVDERDAREEQVTAIYHALGGKNEWSNLHDLGEEGLELAQSLVTERDALASQLKEAREEIEKLRPLQVAVGECSSHDLPPAVFKAWSDSSGYREDRLTKAIEERNDFSDQVARLTREREEARKECERLKGEQQKIRDDCMEAGFFMGDDLTEIVGRMAVECENRKQRLRESASAEAYYNLRASHDGLKEELERKRAECDDLNGEIEELRDERTALRSDMQNLTDERDSLEARLQELEGSLTVAREKAHSYLGDYWNIHGKWEQLCHDSDTSHAQLNRASISDADSLSGRVNLLVEQFLEARKEIEKLKSDVWHEGNRLFDVATENADLTRERDALRERVAELEKEKERDEARVMIERVTELLDSNEIGDDPDQDLHDRVADFVQEYVNVTSEWRDTTRKVKDLESARLSPVKTDAETETERVWKAIGELGARICALEAQ